MKSVGNLAMAERSLTTRESRRGGCHCSRCAGDRGMESKGKEVEELQGRGSGEANLVERCYNTENSAAEHWTLSRLERKLQAAFCFEQGGG